MPVKRAGRPCHAHVPCNICMPCVSAAVRVMRAARHTRCPVCALRFTNVASTPVLVCVVSVRVGNARVMRQ
eukprot:1573302-Lingulodinium_polyedra.AAC.1